MGPTLGTMNPLPPLQPSDPGALTDDDLTRVVHAFYERVRGDAQLGPVFAGAVADWPEHLATLSAFWSSVMLQRGTYKGNPMRVHRLLGPELVTPARFSRWLELWRETTNDLLTPEAAARLQEKASRMAVNLGQAVDAAPTPYRSTPVFDEHTLPAGLRREHRTKAGTWGVIRVLEGQLLFRVLAPLAEHELGPNRPGLVLPEQPHLVEPKGAMRMQVDFYDRLPRL